MMRPLNFLALPFLLLALTHCTRSGASKEAVQADFDRICRAQRDFLEARKMKGVNEAELLVERTRRMREGLVSSQAMGLVDRLIQPEAAEPASLAASAALEAGLEGWACPELGRGP